MANRYFLQTVSRVLPFFLLTAASACNQGSDKPAAGDPSPGDSDTTTLTWPDASGEYLGALQPSLTATSTGTVVLTFVRDANLWLLANPAAGGTATAVGDTVGELTEVRSASAPSGSASFVLWQYARDLWVDEGVPSLPSTHLIDSFDVADVVALTWTKTAPLAVIRTGNDVFAFPIPSAGSALLIPPTAATRLLTLPDAARYFGETPTVVDRGNDRAVVFAPWGVATTTAYGTDAQWVVGHRDPAGSGELGQYFAVEHQGTLAIPGRQDTNRSWVQAHDLGGGSVALTWAETAPGTAVFEVFLAMLSFDADNTPSLASDAVNVSNTTGMTDNSDFPVVRRTSTGDLWVAWRETNRGPRVALYDAALHLIASAKPPTEVHCNDSQAITAAVGPDDTLHVAAVLAPDGVDNLVRYWRFAKP